jgi:hypothetical protein
LAGVPQIYNDLYNVVTTSGAEPIPNSLNYYVAREVETGAGEVRQDVLAFYHPNPFGFADPISTVAIEDQENDDYFDEKGVFAHEAGHHVAWDKVDFDHDPNTHGDFEKPDNLMNTRDASGRRRHLTANQAKIANDNVP